MWANGLCKTTSEQNYVKVHKDGIIEVWCVERIELRRPNRDNFFAEQRFKGMSATIEAHPKDYKWGRVQHSVFYQLTQFFYEPGDSMHNNGKSFDCWPESWKGHRETLVINDFKRMPRVELSKLRRLY
tara:strand:+ start:1107 stop:1490 length:384 start_codon:yes stop_codon:yes gene_type:complete